MADFQEYKCPCCGGAVSFDPNVQKLKCPFCDTEFDMDALKSFNDDLSEEGNSDYTWETTAGSKWEDGEAEAITTFLCKSCGGEILGDKNTASTDCPYCGNPIVVNNNVSGMLKPDFVIPFKYTKEVATEKFKKHLQGKKLLPKAFTEGHHVEEIKGIYVPYWLFDTDVKANIRYKATKVTRWEDTQFKYERTDYFNVVRRGKIAFEKVPVDGSSKMDDTLMESLEPYKFKEATAFNPGFLAGYVADKYDVDAESSVARANERVKVATERAFKETVEGYQSVETVNSVLNLSNGKATYAFYPVWILNTTWNGKKFVFAMNGQTGKFVGNLPCDKGLFWKYLFKAFGLSTVLAFVVQTVLHFI